MHFFFLWFVRRKLNQQIYSRFFFPIQPSPTCAFILTRDSGSCKYNKPQRETTANCCIQDDLRPWTHHASVYYHFTFVSKSNTSFPKFSTFFGGSTVILLEKKWKFRWDWKYFHGFGQDSAWKRNVFRISLLCFMMNDICIFKYRLRKEKLLQYHRLRLLLFDSSNGIISLSVGSAKLMHRSRQSLKSIDLYSLFIEKQLNNYRVKAVTASLGSKGAALASNAAKVNEIIELAIKWKWKKLNQFEWLNSICTREGHNQRSSSHLLAHHVEHCKVKLFFALQKSFCWWVRKLYSKMSRPNTAECGCAKQNCSLWDFWRSLIHFYLPLRLFQFSIWVQCHQRRSNDFVNKLLHLDIPTSVLLKESRNVGKFLNAIS